MKLRKFPPLKQFLADPESFPVPNRTPSNPTSLDIKAEQKGATMQTTPPAETTHERMRRQHAEALRADRYGPELDRLYEEQLDQSRKRRSSGEKKRSQKSSEYYRDADGNVKKIGASPDYLEDMMKDGVPVMQWIILLGLIGIVVYQLRKTLTIPSAKSNNKEGKKGSATPRMSKAASKRARREEKLKREKSGTVNSRSISSPFQVKKEVEPLPPPEKIEAVTTSKFKSKGKLSQIKKQPQSTSKKSKPAKQKLATPATPPEPVVPTVPEPVVPSVPEPVVPSVPEPVVPSEPEVLVAMTEAELLRDREEEAFVNVETKKSKKRKKQRKAATIAENVPKETPPEKAGDDTAVVAAEKSPDSVSTDGSSDVDQHPSGQMKEEKSDAPAKIASPPPEKQPSKVESNVFSKGEPDSREEKAQPLDKKNGNREHPAAEERAKVASIEGAKEKKTESVKEKKPEDAKDKKETASECTSITENATSNREIATEATGAPTTSAIPAAPSSTEEDAALAMELQKQEELMAAATPQSFTKVPEEEPVWEEVTSKKKKRGVVS